MMAPVFLLHAIFLFFVLLILELNAFWLRNFRYNQRLCTTHSNDCNIDIKLIILSAVCGSLVGLLALFLLFYYCSRVAVKRKDEMSVNHCVINIKETSGIQAQLPMCEKSITKMRLHELRKATNNFGNDNIIDAGITGNVYKATLSDGSLVSVKRLWDTQQSKTELLSELNTLGKVKHPNLVSLQGFCIARKEKLLVYTKYMPKRTLYQQLHQIEANIKFKEWPLRLKIALGVARGLAWLHHNRNACIVHRNISSKCILLDGDNNPMISDFGHAKLLNSLNAHLTTFANGQYCNMGYVAPEYTRMLVASPKGDVYSFGILLLELITGTVPTQKANPPCSFKHNLVGWIAPLSASSFLLNAVDKSLTSISCDDELLECVRIANVCVASAPEQRPTMLDVYHSLRAIGNRYGFSADDENLQMPSNNISNHASNSTEQIGSHEICEIHEL